MTAIDFEIVIDFETTIDIEIAKLQLTFSEIAIDI